MQSENLSKRTRHEMANGRTYQVIDTGRPFVDGEYPSGGFVINVLLPSGEWSFIDNAPDETRVQNYLRAAARLPPRTR
jgi:hypothetical protein